MSTLTQQLEFDFDTLPTTGVTKTPKTPVVLEETHTNVLSALEERSDKYEYREDILLGNIKYLFKVSNKVKEGICEFDEKNQHITALYFTLRQGGDVYKFKVGISPYTIGTQSNVSNDDISVRYLRNCNIRYIQKLDISKGGSRLSNKGKVIWDFTYFQYLFEKGFGNTEIMPAIKRAILDIEDTRAQLGEK